MEKWKVMRVQFDVPKGPATRPEIIWFDIKKEFKRAVKPWLRAYMEWFHEMRTGSKNGFEQSTALGFSVLTVAVLLLCMIPYMFCCRCF